MDPVTIAVLVTIGCGLFLAGCASQEKENDELSLNGSQFLKINMKSI